MDTQLARDSVLLPVAMETAQRLGLDMSTVYAGFGIGIHASTKSARTKPIRDVEAQLSLNLTQPSPLERKTPRKAKKTLMKAMRGCLREVGVDPDEFWSTVSHRLESESQHLSCDCIGAPFYILAYIANDRESLRFCQGIRQSLNRMYLSDSIRYFSKGVDGHDLALPEYKDRTQMNWNISLVCELARLAFVRRVSGALPDLSSITIQATPDLPTLNYLLADPKHGIRGLLQKVMTAPVKPRPV